MLCHKPYLCFDIQIDEDNDYKGTVLITSCTNEWSVRLTSTLQTLLNLFSLNLVFVKPVIREIEMTIDDVCVLLAVIDDNLILEKKSNFILNIPNILL